MAAFSKTAGISVISLQELTSAPRVVGASAYTSSEQDVSTKLAATIFARIGRIVTAAFTAGVKVRVEVSSAASGERYWQPITPFQTNLGASVADEAVNGTCASGQNVIPLAITTGFAVGDLVYVDNTTTGNSEFCRVVTVTSNVSVTVADNLTNTQTGATVYNQAEEFIATIDLIAIKRIRIVVDGSGAGQNFAVEVFMVTGDSIA
mgnify:CR=1 FL=1